MELCVMCPNCNDYVILEKLNCCIFRHGVYKHNLQQIHPHLPENECKKVVEHGLIYGCGKPFKIIIFNNELKAEICEYI